MDGLPVHIAVLTIAEDAATSDRSTARAIAERATAAGHQIVDEEFAKDSESAIRDQLVRWIAEENIDVVIVAASVESEAASAALAPLVHQTLPGFTDLFRWLTFQEIGASAMLSAAEAAQCQSTFVFVLPAHEAAVRAAMDKLILPQLDARTKPKNLVTQMPRLKDAAKRIADAQKSQPVTTPPATVPAITPAAAFIAPPAPTVPRGPDAVPVPVEPASDKTVGGPGLPPRLPARSKTRTANTIPRKQDDPPTKEIDLARLEKQIALSNANDAHTKEVDLKAHDAKTKIVDMSAHQAKTRVVDSRQLPRVPPGADEPEEDDEALTFSAPPGTNPAQAQAEARATRTSAPIGVVKTRSDGTQPGTPVPTRAPATPSPAPPLAKPPSPTTPAFSTPIARSTPPTRPPSATPPALPAVPSVPPRQEVITPSTPVIALRSDARKQADTPVATPVVTRPGAPTPLTNPALPRQTATTPVTNPTVVPDRNRPPTPPPPPPVQRPPTTPPPAVASETPKPAVQPNAAELWARAIAPAPAAAVAAPASTPAPAASTSAEPQAAGGDDDAPSPIATLLTNQPVRKRPPTPPPVHLESLAKPFVDGELPQGDFSYPIKRSGAGMLLKIVLALAVLGLGFFAFIKLYPADDKPTQTASVTPPPPAPVVETAPAPAAVVDAAPAEPPTPVAIEQPAPPAPTPAPAPTRPTPTARPTSSHASGKPVTSPQGSSATPEPTPAEPKPDPAPAGDKPAGDKPAGECDEVSCVLAKYDRPCCERFKPADSFTPKNVVPDELDRSMVKSGVENIKPKIVACGEQHSAKGTVKVAVTVDPEGSVKSVSVTEAPDTALGECVAGAMRRAKFGKSVNGGEFNYPFVF